MDAQKRTVLLAPTGARSVVFRNSNDRFSLSFPMDKLKRIFVSFPEIPMKIRNKNKIVGGVPRKLPQRGTRVGFFPFAIIKSLVS